MRLWGAPQPRQPGAVRRPSQKTNEPVLWPSGPTARHPHPRNAARTPGAAGSVLSTMEDSAGAWPEGPSTVQQQGGSRSWGAGETGRESGHGSWEDAGSCARWLRARPSAPKVGTTRGTPGQPGLAQPGRGTAGPGGAEAGPPLPPCPCVPQGSGTPSYQKRPPPCDTVHSAGWPGPSATPRLWACASPPALRPAWGRRVAGAEPGGGLR